MKVRALCWMLCAVLFMLPSCSDEQRNQDWKLYKQHFLRDTGAIVDAVNGDISHSEGQGMGMLLATAYADEESFERIWAWSKEHLQVHHEDALLVWRWQPKMPHISDYNNATDGDILAAWSLLRAYEKWGNDAYLADAKVLMHDIREHLIVADKQRLLLLPGMQGFKRSDGYIVNLSYWIFPALLEFQRFEPRKKVWGKLIESGLNLIDNALFGVWKLPPDWLFVGDKLYPASPFPKHFGLDAVRIPLYLSWAKYSQRKVMQSSAHFWQQFTAKGAWPEWASLETSHIYMSDQVIGVESIAAMLHTDTALQPHLDWDKAEYYQSTLFLISQLAIKEMQ